MSNVLNEEIRAIQTSIIRLNQYVAIETNQNKKQVLKNKIQELNEILNAKLGEDTNYEY